MFQRYLIQFRSILLEHLLWANTAPDIVGKDMFFSNILSEAHVLSLSNNVPLAKYLDKFGVCKMNERFLCFQGGYMCLEGDNIKNLLM